MTEIHAIDIAGYDGIERPASLGPAATLNWLPIERLRVDTSYQRTIGNKGSRNVRRIAERFDWRLFAPVIVSPIEGGLFAIVDGQHRTTAAALVGAEQVPCSIILADRVQQAKAFAAVNGDVTRLTTTQMWRARAAAGDAAAVAAGDVCARANVRIVHNKAASFQEPNECSAIGTIERLAKVYPPTLLVLTLRCLLAGARGQGGVLTSNSIAACTAVLHGMEKRPDAAVLVDLFRSIDVKRLGAESERDAKLRPNMTVLPLFEAALTEALEALLSKPKQRMAVPA